MKKTASKQNLLTIKLFWIIGLLVVWEVVSRLGLLSPMLLPTLSDVIEELIKGLYKGKLLYQCLQSIGMVLIGLIISIVVGTLMVYLDYYYPVFQALFEVMASILHPLPGIALLPVVVLWAGVGMDAVLLIIIHAILWSFYLTLKMGFVAIDQSLIEAARNNGAHNFQLFKYVLLPGSMASVLTGIRVGWSRGWRGLISAEMIFGAISAIGGIGWFMYERRAFGDIKGTYAGIVLVAIVGIVVEQIVFRRIKVID